MTSDGATTRRPYELIDNKGVLRFMFQFTNAEQFYVTSRVSMYTGLAASGFVLAQQALELYIKSIIIQLNRKPDNHHHLIKQLKKVRASVPYFEALLGDDGMVHLLDQLTQGYLSQRYGEKGYSLDTASFIAALDELAFNLRKVYLRLFNLPDAKLYVPSELMDLFLKDNALFGRESITSHPIASMMPTATDLPDLPHRTAPRQTATPASDAVTTKG